MKHIIDYISRNLISVMGVTILAGTTLSTSVVGMSKVMSQFGTNKTPEVPEIHKTIQQQEINPQTAQTNRSVPSSRSSIPLNISITQPAPTHPVAKMSTTINSSTQTSGSPATSTTNKCIITLGGNQYDVTPLQTSHSGGNIFNCGTDMTSIYIAQHGNNFSRMQPYLIASTSSASNSPTGSPTSTTTSDSNSTSGSSISSNTTTSHREMEDKDEDVSERQSESEKRTFEQQSEATKQTLERENESENDN